MIICIAPNCSINCSDWIIFGLGVIVSIGWALFIYLRFRPKIVIGSPKLSHIDKRSIIIPVTNKKKYQKATRIKIEVSVIDYNDDTYHLSVLEDDFAFLSPKETREFKAYRLNEYLTNYLSHEFEQVLNRLNNPNYCLRIRLHLTDSFSGLGKTYEQEFSSVNADYKKYGFNKSSKS